MSSILWVRKKPQNSGGGRQCCGAGPGGGRQCCGAGPSGGSQCCGAGPCFTGSGIFLTALGSGSSSNKILSLGFQVL